MPTCSAPRARVVWVLIDGVGDVGLPTLDKKTLLQSFEMRSCDGIAAAGVSGLMDPVQAGLACGSDTAHLSLFGYDPRQYYRGRGAFETMGAGLDMLPGDIAFKCNFAYLNTSTNVVELRRADRNFEDVGPTLCKMLDGQAIPSFPNHTVAVKYATEHRCGVRVRGPGLSDNVTGTDPLKDNLPLRKSVALDSSEEAVLTARLVNTLSRHMTQKLQEHVVNRQRIQQGKPPANCVLLRGCGARVQVPTFVEKHGLASFMIAPTCLIRGLGISLEMDIIDVPGATGDYFTDLSAKARYALKAIGEGCSSRGARGERQRRYDLGFVHVKAVDDAGHDKSLDRKAEWLQKIDGMVMDVVRGLAAIEEESGDRLFVCVTGDHSTPVNYGDHSPEPIPFSIAAVRDVVRLLDQDTNNGSRDQKDTNTEGTVRRDDQDATKTKFGAQGARHACAHAPCDAVTRFDEISAVRGALGRFQGLQVMGIIKRFCALTCGRAGVLGDEGIHEAAGARGDEAGSEGSRERASLEVAAVESGCGNENDSRVVGCRETDIKYELELASGKRRKVEANHANC